MGHNLLGRLPKTRRWREVVALLDTSPGDTAAIASAAAQAADRRFRELANDPGIGYCFWLLTRVAWAARDPSFTAELNRLGIEAKDDDSTLGLIAAITERVRRELADLPSAGHFSEMASLSLRRALSETVGQQGPSLFESSVEDARRAFRTFSTRGRFGELAHGFFADFFSRSLRSFVDRELSNYIGPEEAIPSIDGAREFLQALDTHARQSARIVEEFAGSWFSKHNWESKGEITREETRRFIALAMRKLRAELKQGGAAA